MQASDPSRPVYRFGDFEFEPRTGELRKQGQKVKLREQPCQMLMLLLGRPGDLVTREEARQALWPGDTFVDFDVGLNSAVKRLRDALDDSADHPRFVETLPRRGYRFIGAVEPPPAPAPPPLRRSEEAPPALAAPAAAEAPDRARPFRFSRVAAPLTLLTIVLAALVLSGTGDPPRRGASDAVQVTSIAVLPFEDLSGGPEQDYFVDGVTDALITSLGQVRALRVISRTSVMQYKHTDKLLPRIAQDLNVDAVVEGTMVRSGDRVRVTAQLIHARTDHHLWAGTFERELRDVLALQTELAGAIARAVKVQIRPEERRRLTAQKSVDPDAYDAYLRGRFFWNRRSPDDLRKAVEYFQQAIERDPGYAAAYSGLSDAYRMFGLQLLPPRECMPKAEAAARKALALDDTLAEAHASLAGVLYRYQWDWEGAEREFQRSLELDPSYAESHRAYALYLLTVRRNEEALAAAGRARELSPLSPVINVDMGATLVRVGRYDEAIEQAQRALEIDPKFGRAYMTLAAAYEGQGDRPGAVAALEKAASLSGRVGGAWLAYFYGLGGRRREALAILASLEERSRNGYVTPQHFAVVHLGLGNEDEAFAYLEKAYEERAFEILGFSGRLYDRLRGDPRFQDLLRRMRLPTAALSAQ